MARRRSSSNEPLTIEEHHWRHWSRSIRLCCGPILFQYLPGSTLVRCTGCHRQVALPDWQPAEAVKAFNAMTPPPK